MAMIRCSKCGEEISDKANQCIHCGKVFERRETTICNECGTKLEEGASICNKCGCPVNKSNEIKIQPHKNKNIKKFFIAGIIIVFSVAVVVALLFNMNKQKIKNEANVLNQKIEQYANLLPDKSSINEMVNEYNNLSNEQKKLITNYATLAKMEQLDVDAINRLQEQIDKELENTSPKYSDVTDIESQYDELSSEDKGYIKNIEKILAVKKLTDYDKAALCGVNNIRKVLKDKNSMSLETVTVIDETEKMGYYYVLIKYSATNSFGGAKSSSVCFAVNEEFEDPFFSLSLLTGVDKYFDSLAAYNEYVKSDQTEITIDCDKIMANAK